MSAAPPSGASTGLGADGWAAGDGVRLHYISRGDGPVVLLLHGFPDFWYGWRHQLAPLADAGFRAVAVDLRGYNLSQRPARVADYALDRLAGDVAALARSLGGGRVHVVGHDWGGAVAWRVAARRPEAVDRLVVLNAPHPRRFWELLGTPAQALRSWYIGAVQVPLVPEALLAARGRSLLHATWTAMHRRPGAFTDEDHARYDAAFPTASALRAALAYYRAAARGPRATLDADGPPDGDVVRAPTLVLWGEDDPALVRANAEGLERWVPDVRVQRVPGAGHFVQADAPAVVNEALVGFLRG
ncbi:epoxide hydrolase [Gemmatimonadetes bacterium T265]|nr:epoxide hydrolase [Gemmatimonadetes bacterium T265]